MHYYCINESMPRARRVKKSSGRWGVGTSDLFVLSVGYTHVTTAWQHEAAAGASLEATLATTVHTQDAAAVLARSLE